MIARLLFGPPGSGKSTFAATLPGVTISRDAVRAEMVELYPLVSHDDVWAETLRQVRHHLLGGRNIILDSTLSNPVRRRQAAQTCSMMGAQVWLYRPSTSLEECIRRNNLRTGTARVPGDHLTRIYHECEAAVILPNLNYIDKVIPF